MEKYYRLKLTARWIDIMGLMGN